MRQSHRRHVPRALTALALVTAAHPSSAAGPSLRPLDFYPRAVSADGSVVVGVRSNQALRWTAAGGVVPLGRLPGDDGSDATDVSANGAVVVGFGLRFLEGNSFEPQAFRWTAGEGMVGLGAPGGGSATPSAVSADGTVVVGHNLPRGSRLFEAFRWTPSGGMSTLGSLSGAVETLATDVSADGSVVVGWGDSVGTTVSQAFRWTAGSGMVGLGFLPGGDRSVAVAVSADGSVIVGHSFSGVSHEAFRWTADGGMVGLGALAGHTVSGTGAVSADGSLVVGTSSELLYDEELDAFTYGAQDAFIWDGANGMRLLQDLLTGLGADVNGWHLQSASAISADGSTIVGYGSNADGPTGWIVTIPEPAAMPLASLLVIHLLRRGRTTRRKSAR